MNKTYAQFEYVKPLILKLEGDRETNSPHDYGGKSKYRISQRDYSGLDIDRLEETRAFLILETDYWEKFHLSQLKTKQ